MCRVSTDGTKSYTRRRQRALRSSLLSWISTLSPQAVVHASHSRTDFSARAPLVLARSQDQHVIGALTLHSSLQCMLMLICRKGGPLAVTDANLVLGRLVPDYFPKIFGKSEKEPLDIEASRTAFEQLAKDVNRQYGQEGKKEMGLDEIVYGFIKVANETMCRPIRALTEARGYSTANHVCVAFILLVQSLLRSLPFSLASFGGAGGQHACEIAQVLGIKTILVHRHSSILSAYGLALADR